MTGAACVFLPTRQRGEGDHPKGGGGVKFPAAEDIR
jgi:hypothetical protein